MYYLTELYKMNAESEGCVIYILCSRVSLRKLKRTILDNIW
jgi:hypothetical protein